MPFVTVGEENHRPISIHFEDHGSGRPVLLVHGFLLSGHSWEKQEAVLLEAGYRVCTYDRRGFGASSQPSVGYDFNTLAADLDTLMTELDLYDTTLVGHSMGTGEVVRYLRSYGSDRVTSAVLLAPLPPFLLQTVDNPNGIGREIFEQVGMAMSADRPGVIKTFLDNYYNIDVLGGHRVSDQVWQQSFIVAVGASTAATLGCLYACLEDFRDDLSSLDVPVLAMQGNEDRILPLEVTGDRLSSLVRWIRYIVIHGAPHAIIWTHADEVNAGLLDFLESVDEGRL
jgi:non-heme chloroperoxidase